MALWYRIFGASTDPPEPDALLQHLRDLGAEATGRFRGDEQGWFRGELTLAAGAAPVEVERFLATEEGIRTELNTWAAWIEAAGDSPTHLQLMQQMISTRQLITLHVPDDPQHHAVLDRLCTAACQFLARQAGGIYQIDGQGLYGPDGALLVREG